MFDALAPTVSDAVGLRETERESETVELGVCDGVSVLVAVMLAVGVGLGCSVVVDDGGAPTDSEEVGDANSEAERRDAVVDGGSTPSGDVAGALVDGERVCDKSGANEKLPLKTDARDGELPVDCTKNDGATLNWGGVAEPELVIEALAPCVNDDVGVCETDGNAFEVSDDVGDGVEVDVPEPACVAEMLSDAELVSEPLAVTDADAPVESVAVGVQVIDKLWLVVVVDVGEGEDVLVSVPEFVALEEAVGVGVGVDDSVVVGENDGVLEAEGVPLAEPPTVSVADGVADKVVERLCVVVGVLELDGVSVPVGEDDPVGVEDSVVVVEPVPESDPVFEELAPIVIEAVGDRDTDLERLNVGLGVAEGVAVPELVGEPVDVALLEALAVMLAVSDTVAVILALEPWVTEGVAVFESDELREDEGEGETDGVAVPEEVLVPVLVCDGVGGDDSLAERDSDGVPEGV